MSLSVALPILQEALEDIFDVNGNPADDAEDFANKVCDAIDIYLQAVSTGGFTGGSIHSSGTGAGFESGDLTPVPFLITEANFRPKLIERCVAHENGEDKDFSECNAAYKEDMALFVASVDEAGFDGVGTTVCAINVDLDDAFDTGVPDGGSSADVAEAVANAIHAATIGTVHTVVSFTGADASGTYSSIPATAGGGGNLK